VQKQLNINLVHYYAITLLTDHDFAHLGKVLPDDVGIDTTELIDFTQSERKAKLLEEQDRQRKFKKCSQ